MPTDAVRQKEKLVLDFTIQYYSHIPVNSQPSDTDRQETHTSRAFTLHRPPESYV